MTKMVKIVRNILSSRQFVSNINVTNLHNSFNKNSTDLVQILGMSFFQSTRHLCHSHDRLSKSFQAYKVWYTWFSYGNIILQVLKNLKNTNLTKTKSWKSSILHKNDLYPVIDSQLILNEFIFEDARISFIRKKNR